jgi:hypothetical protein
MLARLSYHLCVYCNVTNAFGHTHTLMSRQYKVNLGQPKVNICQNEVELPRKQLKAIQNHVIRSL